MSAANRSKTKLMPQIDTVFLNGIRPILALWVALGHFYAFIGGHDFIKIPVLGNIILNNPAAVDSFMLITGFLMMYHYTLRVPVASPNAKTTIIDFWLKRLFRLYPVYIFSIVVAFLLADDNYHWIGENYTYFTGNKANFTAPPLSGSSTAYFDLLLHLTFLHGFFSGFNISLLGPAWSLSTEVQFYFLFPFIFLLFKIPSPRLTSRTLIFLIEAVLLSYLSLILLGDWGPSGLFLQLGAPSTVFHKLSYFMIGMAAALAVLQRISYVPIIAWVVFSVFFQDKLSSITIAILLLLLFSGSYKNYIPIIVYRFILFIKQSLSSNLSQLGSDLTYSIYLVHMILMPGIVNFVINHTKFGKQETAAIALCIFLLVTILTSYILYQFIEKPFINYGKQLLKRRQLDRKLPQKPLM